MKLLLNSFPASPVAPSSAPKLCLLFNLEGEIIMIKLIIISNGRSSNWDVLPLKHSKFAVCIEFFMFIFITESAHFVGCVMW